MSLPAVDLFPFLWPVLLVVLGALITLVAEPFLSIDAKHRILPWIGIAAAGAAAWALKHTQPGHIHGMLAIDPFRAGLVLALLLVLALGLAGLQRNLSSDRFAGGEPYVLVQLATVGVMLMVFASQTVALFLGMELASLAIYPLVGSRRSDLASAEAVLKYFVSGAAFSAVFLFGAAMVFGATGSLFYGAGILAGRETVALVGFFLMAIGLLFKLGVVPFHFWSPDAYSGAPSGATAFMAGAVKIGALAALASLWMAHLIAFAVPTNLPHGIPLGISIPPFSLGVVFQGDLFEALQVVHGAAIAPIVLVRSWIFLLAVPALISILVGSFSLLGQTSVRRLLAFSGIANAGFLVIGLGLYTKFGKLSFEPGLFYLAVYAISTSGALAGIAAFTGAQDKGDNLSSLAGAARQHPWIGLCVTILLASLAGLPPAAGFVAKFQILTGLFLNLSNPTVIWLPISVLACALIATAGYFRLAVVLWAQPESNSAVSEPPPVLLQITVGLAALAVLALAIFPDRLFGV